VKLNQFLRRDPRYLKELANKYEQNIVEINDNKDNKEEMTLTLLESINSKMGEEGAAIKEQHRMWTFAFGISLGILSIKPTNTPSILSHYKNFKDIKKGPLMCSNKILFISDALISVIIH